MRHDTYITELMKKITLTPSKDNTMLAVFDINKDSYTKNTINNEKALNIIQKSIENTFSTIQDKRTTKTGFRIKGTINNEYIEKNNLYTIITQKLNDYAQTLNESTETIIEENTDTISLNYDYGQVCKYDDPVTWGQVVNLYDRSEVNRDLFIYEQNRDAYMTDKLIIDYSVNLVKLLSSTEKALKTEMNNINNSELHKTLKKYCLDDIITVEHTTDILNWAKGGEVKLSAEFILNRVKNDNRDIKKIIMVEILKDNISA